MGTEPGESSDPRSGRAGRGLAQPPSTRYRGTATSTTSGDRASLAGPLAKAAIVAMAGAAALVGVGAILASTAGLLFVSGLTGAGIGLVLARARVPPDSGPAPLSRRQVVRLSIVIAVGSVIVAGVATWLWAVREGGTLGVVDYLLTTFGPFVPGELVVAALGATWGASAGPVQG